MKCSSGIFRSFCCNLMCIALYHCICIHVIPKKKYKKEETSAEGIAFCPVINTLIHCGGLTGLTLLLFMCKLGNGILDNFDLLKLFHIFRRFRLRLTCTPHITSISYITVVIDMLMRFHFSIILSA